MSRKIWFQPGWRPFYFGDHLNLERKTVWISVKTFYFWRSPKFGHKNRLNLNEDQPKSGSRSFDVVSSLQNSPPNANSWLRVCLHTILAKANVIFCGQRSSMMYVCSYLMTLGRNGLHLEMLKPICLNQAPSHYDNLSAAKKNGEVICGKVMNSWWIFKFSDLFFIIFQFNLAVGSKPLKLLPASTKIATK